MNSEVAFGRKRVGLAADLAFHAMNTSSHHILLFLKVGVIEYVPKIDSMNSAELLTEERDAEL